MTAVFLLSLVFILYTYVLYPLGLLLAARGRKRPVAAPARWPSVSLLIPARDEERAIGGSVENVLGLDYPGPREVVVVSDGSRDGTAAVVRSFSDPRLRLLAYESRKGKIAAINSAVSGLSGEIIVFTDASARFAPDALRFLVAPFSDPSVGAASGELVLREEGGGEKGVRVDWYWKMEKFMRRREGAISSCLGATGAIWALRRELFRPLPDDTILDDFLLPLEAVRQGRRIVFIEEAKAFETEAADWHREFRRKVRTLAGNYQAFARSPWLLNPFRSPVAVGMISHKLFRLFIPGALIAAFVSSAFSPAWPRFFFPLQALFYLAALAGWIQARFRGRPSPVLSPPFTFCLLNAAAAWGGIVYFFRRDALRWK
jgi:cellulose synthase/poly-beta-1,6-N-acetylglucosamine synthase-like glycosyltransferase